MKTSLFLISLMHEASTILAEPMNDFIRDIMKTWQLNLPIIVGDEHVPEACLTLERVLCTTNAMDLNDNVDQLTTTRVRMTQDGVIFVGNEGHKQ